MAVSELLDRKAVGPSRLIRLLDAARGTVAGLEQDAAVVGSEADAAYRAGDVEAAQAASGKLAELQLELGRARATVDGLDRAYRQAEAERAAAEREAEIRRLEAERDEADRVAGGCAARVEPLLEALKADLREGMAAAQAARSARNALNQLQPAMPNRYVLVRDLGVMGRLMERNVILEDLLKVEIRP